MSKSVKKLIANKLEQLQKLLNKTDEARVIEADNINTWDSDTLYDLMENCQQIYQLLADKKDKQVDEYGDPIILDQGLCSLIDEYNCEESEESEENDEE